MIIQGSSYRPVIPLLQVVGFPKIHSKNSELSTLSPLSLRIGATDHKAHGYSVRSWDV